MNFDFDEEQYGFRDTITRFLADRYPSGLANAGLAVLWRDLTELGLFALLPGEERGGLGLSFVDLALPLEKLGGSLAAVCVADTLAATDIVIRHGDGDQQRRLLPRLAEGALRVAIAVQEEGTETVPASPSTALVSSAGRYQLRGAKILVPHAAEVDLFLVLTRLADGGSGIVMVEAGRPGLHVRPHDGIDPSCGLARLELVNVPVSDADILRTNGAGAAVARLLDVSATLYAALALGIADTMLAVAVDYARQRVQFGKPIGSFQAIKHRCADLAVAIEAGRSAAYYAFWAIAQDVPVRTLAASMAKAQCGETVRRACGDCIQIHGGMGFTWELGIHHYLRRARVLESAFGDAAYHRERVLTERLLELAGTGRNDCLHVA